jgi:hypothetical protein
LEGPPQEEIEREAAWEVEVRIFAMLLARMAVGKATYNGLEEWVGRAMALSPPLSIQNGEFYLFLHLFMNCF